MNSLMEKTEELIVLSQEGLENVNFAMKVNGNGMFDRGIYSGDYVFVKKQDTACPGDITVMNINGSMMLKQFVRTIEDAEGALVVYDFETGCSVLMPDTDQFEIFGVVTGLQRLFGSNGQAGGAACL